MKDVPYRVYTDIRRHGTKFSRHGELASGICAPWRARVCVYPLTCSPVYLCSCWFFPKLVCVNFSENSYNKSNEMHFSNLFVIWYRNLHASDRFIVHYQESSTVYTAIGICHTHPELASRQSTQPVWQIPIAMYTVLDSWWWTVNLSIPCRILC
jgi:hypothetical protein